MWNYSHTSKPRNNQLINKILVSLGLSAFNEFFGIRISMFIKVATKLKGRKSWKQLSTISLILGALTYDVRCFWDIFDLPTYPNQILYYISPFRKIRCKIRCSLTYLPKNLTSYVNVPKSKVTRHLGKKYLKIKLYLYRWS